MHIVASGPDRDDADRGVVAHRHFRKAQPILQRTHPMAKARRRFQKHADHTIHRIRVHRIVDEAEPMRCKRAARKLRNNIFLIECASGQRLLQHALRRSQFFQVRRKQIREIDIPLAAGFRRQPLGCEMLQRYWNCFGEQRHKVHRFERVGQNLSDRLRGGAWSRRFVAENVVDYKQCVGTEAALGQDLIQTAGQGVAFTGRRRRSRASADQDRQQYYV
ncbi:MAG: hypothetical protein ACT4PS_18800 [Betaproteobacteria bacterium]